MHWPNVCPQFKLTVTVTGFDASKSGHQAAPKPASGGYHALLHVLHLLILKLKIFAAAVSCLLASAMVFAAPADEQAAEVKRMSERWRKNRPNAGQGHELAGGALQARGQHGRDGFRLQRIRTTHVRNLDWPLVAKACG